MSVLESVQDQLLEAMTAGEDAVLTGIKSLAQSAQPIAGLLPDVPFADRLPNPVDFVDSAFGFAEKLLANQKDFAIKLVEAYRSDPASPKPAVTSATKAARTTRPSAKAS